VGTPPVSLPAELPRITADAAGPIRLGMKGEDVRKLPNFTVTPMTVRLEGTPTPSLQVSQFGMPIALAELEQGVVRRITVAADRYQTEKGARVGMTARDLDGIYGAGQVHTGEGSICATFGEAPGRSFCFQPDRSLLNLRFGDWPKVVQKNPRVRKILVVGAGR
jgi:hypothetical protein